MAWDVLVVGAGAVGTSAAWHLAQRGLSVAVLEKEPGPALHQSGRNSGVIHAGYQYDPASLKARFATEGARRLRAYCTERGIPMEQGGLLVVARDQEEAKRLQGLADRAAENGVEATFLPDGARLAAHESEAAGVAGLHVPAYASFDARAYVHALASDARRAGADLLYDTRVDGIEERHDGTGGSDGEAGVRVRTSKGTLEARVAINAAGLNADRLARELCQDMRIVPFRGYYAELRPDRAHLVRSHIYPTPDPALPFLGVHFSRRADGRVIVGPGAMLAFGRQAYRFHQVSPRDLGATLAWPGFWRLLFTRRMLRLTREEVAKSLSLRALWREARRLVPALEPGDLVRSFAGNRAQMVSRDGRLVMDLVVRETDRVVHVLNAVSPGLTSSLPFGEHLADLAAERVP